MAIDPIHNNENKKPKSTASKKEEKPVSEKKELTKENIEELKDIFKRFMFDGDSEEEFEDDDDDDELDEAGPSGISARELEEADMCNNSMYGCKFSSSDPNIIERHENWLCKISQNCLQCFDDLELETKIEHLENNHIDCFRTAVTLPNTNGAISKVYTTIQALDMEDCQVGIRNCHNRTFIAVFEFSSSSNSNILFLITDEMVDNTFFTIKYRIVSKDNQFQHFGDLDFVVSNDQSQFWYTEFPKFQDLFNQFNFSMTIKKWECM